MGNIIITYLKTGWERVLFGAVGFACLGFTFWFLWHSQVTSGSALFAMAFFSFFYSNLSRFKKFEGLGFKAELWEDKQKEAAKLIDRLKSVVTIYSREIIMTNVMRGRLGTAPKWKQRWMLYDEIVSQHVMLGQDIDFRDVKRNIDDYFIFDMCSPLYKEVRRTISEKINEIAQKRQVSFGSPITDVAGFNVEVSKLRAIKSEIPDLFETSKRENIARIILSLANDAKSAMEVSFTTSINFDEATLQRLDIIADLADHRPIAVTEQLLQWADARD